MPIYEIHQSKRYGVVTVIEAQSEDEARELIYEGEGEETSNELVGEDIFEINILK